jgi:hypothetical protein
MLEQKHYNITLPRFLERLGELPIEQFQCLGELIDNPINKSLKKLLLRQQR